MPINQLVLPYPDFQNLQIIDPEKFDANNEAIRVKVDEISAQVNILDLTSYYTKVQTDAFLLLKADKTNVLQLDNTALYIPTLEYHPATKKYVDDLLLPSAVAYSSGKTQNISSDWTFTGTIPKHNLAITSATDIVNKNYVDVTLAAAALGQAIPGSVDDSFLSDAPGQIKDAVSDTLIMQLMGVI